MTECIGDLLQTPIKLKSSTSSASLPSSDISESEVKKSDKPLIIACIPAYNEERSIGSVILDVRKYVDKVFVCDDGSYDHTKNLAEALGGIVVSHESNMGKGAATRTLIKLAQKCNPDVAIFIDADGQHDPSYIPRLVKPILSGEADFVIGSRFIDKSVTEVPFYRRVGLWLFDRTTDTSGIIRDTQSGYRAFSLKMLTYLLNSETNGFGIESEEIALAKTGGFMIKEIPIMIKYNGISRPSKMNPILHGLDIIATLIRLITEEKPLLYLGLPALGVFILGISAGVYLFLGYNQTNYFSLPFALITISGIGLGTFMGTATLILYAISKLKKRV